MELALTYMSHLLSEAIDQSWVVDCMKKYIEHKLKKEERI